MRPTVEYWLGWVFVVTAFTITNYFSMRYAARWALVEAARILGWTK